jgi:hypothetical protein
MPEWGFQELTAVARPHRGHRLGLRLKLAMLDRLALQEPQLTRIMTGNTAGNDHMIAINEQLGFRVLDRWPCRELGVADVPAPPAGHAWRLLPRSEWVTPRSKARRRMARCVSVPHAGYTVRCTAQGRVDSDQMDDDEVPAPAVGPSP